MNSPRKWRYSSSSSIAVVAVLQIRWHVCQRFYSFLFQLVNQLQKQRWYLMLCGSLFFFAACQLLLIWKWLVMKIWNLPEQIRGKRLMAKVGSPHAPFIIFITFIRAHSPSWGSCFVILFCLFSCRRRHVTSHRSSSFTLLQSLAIEDSRDKPTYSVLLGQLFAFIGTNPDQAVGHVLPTTEE